MAPTISTGISTGLLAPVIALNVWTFTMEAWMYATRIPAVSKYKVNISSHATKEEFNAKIPAPIRWKADNYNHLLEQPTQFYAVALTLAFLGAGQGGIADDWDVRLAWAYVGLRVVHSFVQAVSNPIMTRFKVFVVSSSVLLGLTVRAALMLL
jgi:hypothetical protein